MNFSQLQYFIDIVRLGTFSKAANKNHISQSSFSKQIKALETELGVSLFEREHSRATLSDSGKLFLPFAEQAIKSYCDIIHTLEVNNPIQDRHISLGLIPIDSTYQISSMLAEFQSNAAFPINIDIYEESQQDIVSLLENNVIDVAFVRTESLANKMQYDAFLYRKDRIVCVCPQNHRFAKCCEIALKNLEQEQIILLDNKSSLHHLGLSELTKQGISYNILCTVSRHRIILEMVSRGLGVSLLPQSLLQQTEDALYTAIPLVEEIFSEISIVRKKNRPLSPMKKQFWKFITNHSLDTK